MGDAPNFTRAKIPVFPWQVGSKLFTSSIHGTNFNSLERDLAAIVVLLLFVIMVALWNTADHHIFMLWFLSSSSSIFFPRLISAAAHWISTTWCGLSANLECKSEICGTRLAENTGPKNVAKNRHLDTIAQLCRAVCSQPRHVSTIGKTC